MSGISGTVLFSGTVIYKVSKEATLYFQVYQVLSISSAKSAIDTVW